MHAACTAQSELYLSDIPVVADLSHWLSCNKTAATNGTELRSVSLKNTSRESVLVHCNIHAGDDYRSLLTNLKLLDRENTNL